MYGREDTAWRSKAGLLTTAAVLIVTAALLLWALILAPPAAAQHDNEDRSGERSGDPVEVVGPEDQREIADGGVLFIEGDHVPAKGASITLTDEDGTSATLTDGENASLIPGVEGMGIMVEGEPADVSGGDGELDAEGLRVTGSEDVLEQAPESANLESAEAGDAESSDEAGQLLDAKTIKQQVREQIDAGLAESGASSPGMDSGLNRDSTPESTSDESASDKSGGEERSSNEDSSSGEEGSSGEAGAPADDSDSPEGASDGMFDECFPFCESGSPTGEPNGDSEEDETTPEETTPEETTPDGTTGERTTNEDTTSSGEQEGPEDGDSTDQGVPEGLLPDSIGGIGPGDEPTGSPEGSSTESPDPEDGADPEDGEDTPPSSSPDGEHPEGEETPQRDSPEDGSPRGDDTGGADPYADFDPNNPSCSEGFNGVKPHVAAVGCQIFEQYGVMDYSGYRAGDPQDHGKGLALDYMVYEDTAKGDAIAGDLLANQEEFAITYVIWQQQINFGSGWEMMEDRGSPTANHMDHPHGSHAANPAGGQA